MASVLERAQVADRQSLIPGLEHATHDLAGARLRQLVTELDLTRRGVRGEILLHVRRDFLLQLLAGLETGAQRDECLDDLPADLVRFADHAGLRHRWVRYQRALDFER